MLGSAIDYSDGLPRDWQIDQLGNLGTFINGYAFKPTDWRKKGRPIIRIQNLNDPSRPFNYFDDEIGRKYLIVPGDILISWSASLDAFLWKNGEAWLNQHIFKALPDEDRLDRIFFFFAMKYAMVRIATHARGSTMRHVTAKQFKQSELAFPPLPEQRRIAAVLSLVQRAIEEQEQLITLTSELKKALMYKLFTEGTRGESQKQTEIGPIPESWEVVPLGGCLEVIRNGTTQKQNKDGRGSPVTRIETISDGSVNPQKTGYVEGLSDKEVRKYMLVEGDVLLSHINSEPQLGRTAIYECEPDVLIHGMNLLLMRPNQRLLARFLHYLCEHLRGLGVFVKLAGRAVGQSSINQGRLKALEIPRPGLDEQREIVESIRSVEAEMHLADNRARALTELFRALLHRLMTADIRVDHLDLAALGVEVDEGKAEVV